VLYYYHLRHWMSQFTVKFGLLEAALVALLLVYLVRLRAAPLAVFAGGFAASGLEVVLLLAFQILYGSVYQQLGIIVTVFMAGLAAGAFWQIGGASFQARPARSNTSAGELGSSPHLAGQPATESTRPECGRGLSAPTALPEPPTLSRGAEAPPTFNQAHLCHRRQLAWLAFAIAAFAALLPLCLMALARAGGGGLLIVQTAISLLTLLLGALIGMQFPLAGRVCAERAVEPIARPDGPAEAGTPNPEAAEVRSPGFSRQQSTSPQTVAAVSDRRDPAQNEQPAVGDRRYNSETDSAATASRLYTADFVGACLGALLPSTLLIPLIGVPAVCLLIAALNAIAGVVVLSKRA